MEKLERAEGISPLVYRGYHLNDCKSNFHRSFRYFPLPSFRPPYPPKRISELWTLTRLCPQRSLGVEVEEWQRLSQSLSLNILIDDYNRILEYYNPWYIKLYKLLLIKVDIKLTMPNSWSSQRDRGYWYVLNEIVSVSDPFLSSL